MQDKHLKHKQLLSNEQKSNIFALGILFCALIYFVKAILSFVSRFIVTLPFSTIPIMFNQGCFKGFAECFLFFLFIILIIFSFSNRLSVFLLKLASFFVFSFTKRETLKIYWSFLFLILIAAFFSNISLSNQPFWNEDNGNFIARYVNLHYYFPSLYYYDPFWQAGVKAGDFVSGVYNIWLLFYPLLLPEYIDITYKFIAPLLLIFLPIAIYISAKLFGLNRHEATCAAVLSFAAASNWFSPLRCLRAGMYPYFLTSALLPVFFGLVYNLLKKKEKRINLFLVGLVTFFALPHLTFIFMIGGLFFFYIFLEVRNKYKFFQKFNKIKRKKIVISSILLLFFIVFLLSFYMPEILKQAIRLVTKSFFTYEKIFHLTELNSKEIVLQIINWISSRAVIFSVLLFLGCYQILKWIKINDQRGIFIFFCSAWLLFLGIFGSFCLRGSQPVRFLTPAALFLLIPFSKAWCSLGNLLSLNALSRNKRLISISIIFLSLYAIVISTGIFFFSKPSRQNMTALQKWLIQNCSSECRVFIDSAARGLGSTVGRLQQLTGIHFMGEQGFDPDYQSKFKNRLHVELSKEYFRTYNIRFLLLTTREAQKYAEEVLSLRPIRQFGLMKAYQTNIESSFFEKGEGFVSTKINQIHVKLKSNSFETVIIRFHYIEGLKATEGVTILGVDNGFNKKFICIKPNGKTNIKISYNS